VEAPSACLTTFAPASRSLHLCMQNRWWPGHRSLLASVDRANLRASKPIAENAPSAWPAHRLILTAFARDRPTIREPLPQSFGTRGGPSICGGVSRRTCSSITLQLGVSDDQSKLSKLTPPRSFAIRRTHTTKLFDFLINSSRSASVGRAPFFRTSFAATRCCSARNCIDAPEGKGMNLIGDFIPRGFRTDLGREARASCPFS
jgi:hypothetical protein